MPPSHAGQEQFLREMRRLGLDVSRETVDRLEALVSTLERWQKAINLVGKTTMGDIWHRHVLDSAQLKGLIPDQAESLTDLGSGAGFPGLVVAALRPDLDVALIESDARKAAFLGEAARRMTLANVNFTTNREWPVLGSVLTGLGREYAFVVMESCPST